MTSTTPLPNATHKTTLPLFVAAEALSLFGNAAISIVLPWLVLSRTGDPSVAGLVAAVAAVPSILATLVGGWLIDHVGQRRMSIIADIGSALSVAGLAIVDWAFGLDIGWFVVLGVLGALFDVPGMTARETLMGRVSLTSGVTLDRVAAIRQGVFGVAFLAGPAVAGCPAHRARPDPGGLDHRGLLRPGRALHPAAAAGGRRGRADRRSAAARRPRHPVGQPGAAGDGGDRVRQRAADRSADHRPAARALPASGPGGLAGLHHVGVRCRVDRRLDPLRRPRRRSRRLVYVLGLLLQVVGMAGFATLQGFWLVAAGSVMVGIGGGLLSPIFLVFFTERVAERVRGRVLSLVNALAMVAAPIGLSLLALLLTRILTERRRAGRVPRLPRGVRVRPGQPGDAGVRRVGPRASAPAEPSRERDVQPCSRLASWPRTPG